MDFWETVRGRRSVRKYDPGKEVSEKELRMMLETASEAPSAGNLQPWHFVVVRDASAKEQLAQAALGQTFLTAAPIVVAVCADAARSAQRYGRRGAELYCIQDTAAATTHLLLAATALGLGSCWVGAFREETVTRILGLPGHFRPVALVVLGHRLGSPEPSPKRRRLESIISTL